MTTPFEREKELAAMVEAYRRLPGAEPSPELDRAVLENARRALGTPRRHPRWPALLATAATISLAVGLSWQMRTVQETAPREAPMTTPTATMPAPGASAPQPTVVSGDAVDADAAPKADGYSADDKAKDVAGERARIVEDERGALEATTIAVPKPAPAPAAPPSLRKAEAEVLEETTTATAQEEGHAEKARADTRATQDQAPAEPAFVPDPEPAVVTEAPEALAEPVPPPPALEAQREQPAPRPASPAPAPAAAPVTTPVRAATTVPAPADATKQAAAAQDGERDAAATAGPAEQKLQKPLGGASGLELRRKESVRDPDEWLRAIRALQAAGEFERARTELVAFERAWPDYRVPDDIRNLAR